MRPGLALLRPLGFSQAVPAAKAWPVAVAKQNGWILGRASVVGGQQRHLWLGRTMACVLVLLLLLAPAPAQALSWRLPGRGAPAPQRPGGGPALQRLQEVAPPQWVQRMEGALEERDPQVRILAPTDGSLLPDGPWTLRLQVSDWPLVDAGPLGLGPHLVVQLDGQPPRPVVDTEVAMPALSPGSHLLTVYAAKPWGEAHKSPAAFQQIRLHRLAPNPATLPAPGTPQLLPVSPVGLAGAPPLLLDWLLVDAPLQGLRTEALGWRLRVTLNGESVLLDRQIPLWLKGWQPGSNALLLELLDGRGDPLNPPFNSRLQEVIVPQAGEPDRLGSDGLTALEMAVLLGDQSPSVLLPAPAEPVPQDDAAAANLAPFPVPPISPPPEDNAQLPAPSSPPVAGEEGAGEETPLLPSSEREKPKVEQGVGLVEPEEPSPLVVPSQSPAPPADLVPELAPDQQPQPEANPEAEGWQAPVAEAPPEQEPQPQADLTAPSQQLAASPFPAGMAPDAASERTGPEAGLASPLASRAPTAREEVNPDGTLKRPPRPNPLERLRERLKR